MDLQEHEAFKGLLHHYEEVLQENSLTATQRARYQEIRDAVEDALLQVWLPPGMFRRSIMTTLATTGLFSLLTGSAVPPWTE